MIHTHTGFDNLVKFVNPLTAGEAALVYKAYLTTTTKGKELVAVKSGKGVCVCVCVVCVYVHVWCVCICTYLCVFE